MCSSDLYGFGDVVQKDLLKEILKGDTILKTNGDSDYKAETTIVDGKRVITFSGYQSNMSRENQMRLAVMLGHEAYRDGMITGNNNLETRTAVSAHTQMALRMIQDGHISIIYTLVRAIFC